VVVHPRTGLMVSAEGGAFGRLFPLFRFGLGGRLGSGDQYWPFISLTDHTSRHCASRSMTRSSQAPSTSQPPNH
jgi:NAD dependent epimerase/dehydratase family enzyme